MIGKKITNPKNILDKKNVVILQYGSPRKKYNNLYINIEYKTLPVAFIQNWPFRYLMNLILLGRVYEYKPEKQRKIKVWSRKGRCPDCNVGTGSRHNKACKRAYR